MFQPPQCLAKVFGQFPLLRETMLRTYKEHKLQYMAKADDLFAAGWSPVWNQTGAAPDLMSWYWRRPPVGRRKHGRLFKSTDQAWNALRRGKVNPGSCGAPPRSEPHRPGSASSP